MKAERACLAGPLYKSAGLFCLNSEEEEKKKKRSLLQEAKRALKLRGDTHLYRKVKEVIGHSNGKEIH
jgi:hypothetical protein